MLATRVPPRRLGAAHSPPHCTARVDRRVDRRVDAPNDDPTVGRCPHRVAAAIDGTLLTRAVATRYVSPDRSTVIAAMHTAFGGQWRHDHVGYRSRYASTSFDRHAGWERVTAP